MILKKVSFQSLAECGQRFRIVPFLLFLQGKFHKEILTPHAGGGASN